VPQVRTHVAILLAVRSGGHTFRYIHKGLQALQARREAADYDLRSEPLGWSMVHGVVGRSRELIRIHIKGLPDAEFRRLVLPRR
jgi:hypothetical protein